MKGAFRYETLGPSRVWWSTLTLSRTLNPVVLDDQVGYYKSGMSETDDYLERRARDSICLVGFSPLARNHYINDSKLKLTHDASIL